MKIISPSLLAANFVELKQDIEQLNQIDNLWLHLDIMDGHFVPNLTFGGPVIKSIADTTKKPLDAHLMVSNPRFHLELLKDMNIFNITFHYEATSDSNELVELITKAKEHYPSVGISTRPATALNDIPSEVWPMIDLFLLMSVEPGFGGQSFLEETWQKLEWLRPLAQKHHFSIQVDGGVNGDNAAKLFECGADNLVAGSFIFKHGRSQISNQIEMLRS